MKIYRKPAWRLKNICWMPDGLELSRGRREKDLAIIIL